MGVENDLSSRRVHVCERIGIEPLIPSLPSMPAPATHLKVCCIRSEAEAALAISLGATAVGLVSAMPSGPGVIGDDAISRIAAWVPRGIATFLLTSRTDAKGVVEHVIATGVNTVQLVDAVHSDVYAALRDAAPAVRIVQVIHVEDEASLDEAMEAQEQVDVLLLDSGRPKAAVKELGGTGRTHDWSLSARIVAASRVPVYLAGGLNPSNVRDAIAAVRPYGIDLCSGVRTNGLLDRDKLGALVTAMR